MRFLIDAQLPPALADWLNERGHSAEHVIDSLLNDAADSLIWDHALETGATIITKDEDFRIRAKRVSGGPAVVWLRIGNATNRNLLSWLEPRWPAIVQLLTEGDRLIEVR